MKNFISLPGGCYCSTPKVSPSNWNGKGASTANPWAIHYRFYDPKILKSNGRPAGYQVKIKGMNEFKNLADRRQVCRDLIANEISNLKDKGYNPRLKEIIYTASSDIENYLPLMQALELSRLKLKCAESTKKDIKSALKYIERSAVSLQFNTLPIKDIRRKHISMILDNCSKVKKYWSPHLFNHYRAYLMMCFKKLVELEAIEYSPVDEHITKEIVEVQPRKTLSQEQTNKVLNHFANDTCYLRFIHIFFHSGARPVELLRLRTEDVNLQEGFFTVKVKKGNRIRVQQKPIKKVALSYWTDIMAEAAVGDYLFGRCLKPGIKPCTRDYITKKWNREVKKKLDINIDLYSLKHKNLDEIAAYLSIKEAQKAAGHESPVITMVYAIGEKKRENERYASVPNVLGG